MGSQEQVTSNESSIKVLTVIGLIHHSRLSKFQKNTYPKTP